MNKFNLSIFILFICLFISCREYKEIRISSVDKFTIKKIDSKGIETEITVGLTNPNPIGFTVYRSSFSMNYSGMHLGNTVLRKRVKIPANSNAKHVFILKYQFKDFNLSDLTGLINGKGGKLEIKGHLKAGKFFIRKKYPVELNEKVLPDLGGNLPF